MITKNMDIVIPYRWSDTDELKYCLRSLKNIPHREVFIVGDKPDFINDKIIFIKNSQKGNNCQHDSELSLRLALQDDRLSDEFMLFNDDFFIMDKIEEIENYNSGTLLDKIKSRPEAMFHNHNQGMKNTIDFLGDKNALNYELHIPMIMNKQKRLELSQNIVGILERKLILPRSIYGNTLCDIKDFRKDVKLYHDSDEITDKYFASTTNSSFNGRNGDIIKSKFNRKCRYEI